MNQRELPVFYSFRFLCSFMVFLYHAKMIGSIGGDFVTFFIVLSGFFAVYTFQDSYLTSPFLEGIHYLFRKIKKFYPIHIAAFLLILPISFETFRAYGLKKTCVILLSYHTYTQAFFPEPDYYFAFNGAEWTMSVLCFCYFMTPFIVRLLQKQNPSTPKKYLILLTVIYFLEIIYVFSLKTNENCVWFCSINPLFRILDYFAGCGLGYLYQHYVPTVTTNRKKDTLIQLTTLTLAGLILTCVIPNVHTAYRWSLLMMPISVLVIFIFAFSENETIIYRLLCNPLFITFGKISYEIYILHVIVLEYLYFIGFHSGYLYAGIGFLLTAVLSFILHHLQTKRNVKTHSLSKKMIAS